MKPEQRLRTPAEFAHARERAPRGWPHRLLVLYAVPNDLGRTRVGITVSGRVGKAVVRNRVRRRLRHALHDRLEQLIPGLDVLLIARPPSAIAGWAELCTALDTVLARANATSAVTTNV